MLEKIIKTANKSEKELTFEIGSNSDLVLENTITNNLVWTIENFKDTEKGKLTFPTKFAYVDDLLPLDHKHKVIIRMSVNPECIINHVEFGTSRLKERVEAINKLVEADYEVGILIAPVIFLENWRELYHELILYLRKNLSQKAIEIFDKSKMTGRGKGKYMYQTDIRKEGEEFFRKELNQYFKDNKIWYIV